LYGPAGIISTGAANPGQAIAELTDNWQRPTDVNRIQDIGEYYAGANQIMSNPLLLSVQTPRDPAVTIVQNVIGVSPNTNATFVELEITYPANAAGPTSPFIVIDGQHRLEGMGITAAVRNEPIPFVLLWDDTAGAGAGVYTGAYQAETFTTVTTTAKDLQQPHKDWMRFTFGFKGYDTLQNESKRKSYEAVLFLCSQNRFAGEPNPIFYDRIRFNPSVANVRQWGYLDSDGFALDATKLSSWILKFYYELGGVEDPVFVATNLSNALAALAAVDPNAGTTSRLFPGPAIPGYTGGLEPVYSGVVQGILRYLATPAGVIPVNRVEWDVAIVEASLNGLDWNFDGTVGSRISGTDVSGSQSGWSKDIMAKCFAHYLRERNPAVAPINFIEYIFGRGARVEFVAVETSPRTNRPLWGRAALGFPTTYRRSYNLSWPTSPIDTNTTLAFNMQGGGAVPGGGLRRSLVVTHCDTTDGFRIRATPNCKIKRNRSARYWATRIAGNGTDASNIKATNTGLFLNNPVGTSIWIELEVTSFSRHTERKFRKQVTV